MTLIAPPPPPVPRSLKSSWNKNLIIILLCFSFTQDLLDSSKGYVQDDAITLEVYVQADAAAGLDVTPAQSNGYNLRRRGQTPWCL